MAIDIHNILSVVAADLSTTVSFEFGSVEWQNYQADEDGESDPILYVNEPITSDDEFSQGGRIIEKYAIEFMMAVLTDEDTPQILHDTAVTPMRALRQEYIERLKEKRDVDNRVMIETITSIKTSNVIGIFDGMFSGVIVTMIIQPYDYTGQCL